MSVTGWVIIAIVVVGIVAALFSSDGYRGSRKTTSGNTAQPTDEVFIDPETGRKMRARYEQRSGKREYRPE
jgi:hypothetical protein